MKELSLNIDVNDKDVRDFYNKLKEDGITNKELSKMYDQIKLFLFKERQNRAIQDWVDSLRKKTKIIIDYQSLGITENK